MQVLLSEEELKQTKALAADFGKPGGVGEKLQKLLEKRAKERDSWVCAHEAIRLTIVATYCINFSYH